MAHEPLTRDYLDQHKNTGLIVLNSEGQEDPSISESDFLKALANHIIEEAKKTLTGPDASAEEINISLPITLTPAAANIAEGKKHGCVWINVGFAKAHFPFDGSFPG